MGVGAVARDGLLERGRERGRLRRLLRAAGVGHGATCVVTGRPRIGKTGLVHAFAEDARDDSWRVVAARGSQLEQEFAFGVVRQMLAVAALSGVVGTDASHRGDPDPDRTLVDVLSEQPELSSPASAASEFQLLHQLYWWVVRLTDDSPLLVVVDDAQWGDLSSLRFLRFLALRCEPLPLMLVVASRSVDDPRRAGLIAALGEDASTVVLEPQPLSRGAVEVLVEGRLGPSAEAFIDACLRVTGGNPLNVDLSC